MPSMALTPPMPLPRWVDAFQLEDLPVLDLTRDRIAALASDEDNVDAHVLADVVNGDPLMLLRVLGHVSSLTRGRRGNTEVETALAALVMMGISPFFRAFSALETVAERLAGRPEALQGLHTVIERGNRAARFAMAFAVHRMDHDAAVIHEAALLHDFAELLVWLRVPDAALEVARRQREDAQLRSAAVQRDVLGVALNDLQQALMKKWSLPSLLVAISDDRHRGSPRVRNVMLAIQLARHSSLGWENPALPDDFQEIAELLNLDAGAVMRLVTEIDRPG